MTTFYLHIGMNKTASSAIQKCFFDNRRKIRAAIGVDYAPLPTANHTRFLQVYFKPPTENETANAASRRRRDWYADGFGERFEAFVAYLARSAGKGRDVLLSGEGANNIPPEELGRLRDLALSHFDRVVILGFVRPLHEFARSACAQRITTGRPLDFFLNAPPVPNYRKRFERFFEVFGRDSVRLAVFEPHELVDGDPFHTLLAMMDVDRQRIARLHAPRTNVTLRLTASKFLSHLNVMVRDGAIAPDLPAPLRAPIAEGNLGLWLEAAWARRRERRPAPLLPAAGFRALEAMTGAAFVLPREVAERVVADSAADTAWMSEVMGRDIGASRVGLETLPPFQSYLGYGPDEIDALGELLAVINRAGSADFRHPGKHEEDRFRARSRRSLRALGGWGFSLERVSATWNHVATRTARQNKE